MPVCNELKKMSIPWRHCARCYSTHWCTEPIWGAAVQIRVYDDRLSIWNEKGLPLGLRLENLKEEHNSRPRNPKIADACFKAGYIDAWGRGTLKIINSCKEAALPEPEIIEKDGGVQVTIFKVNENTENVRLVDGLVDGLVDRLVDSQQVIIKLITSNPKISKREMAKHIGISTTAIEKNLSALKDKEIIKRVGSDRSGYWEILVKQ